MDALIATPRGWIESFGDLVKFTARIVREVLTLRYALDYSTQQIAEALAINATAVHMRLSRARQRLAERLAAQGVTHSV